MTCANAKPAALQRLWHMLTRKAGKHGSPRPALFTSRRSNGIGSSGAQVTGETSCPQNTAIPITEILTRDRLKARALIQFNRDLQAVEQYVQRHMILARKDLTCE